MSLSPDIQEYLQRPSTEAFLSAARRFVELLETRFDDHQAFCRPAHDALLNLYTTAHCMDPISAKHALDVDFDRDAFFVNRNAGLIAKLGSRTLYWEVFNPIAFEESQVPADQEATLGSLVDDFADIHRDLVVELEKVKLGTDAAVEDAFLSLQWSFRHHWGNHCIGALRCLHFLTYPGKKMRYRPAACDISGCNAYHRL